jgi:prepilin peptidase CpaA
MLMKPEVVYAVAALLCALTGAAFDIKSRRVPNFITGPGILLGLVLHLSLGGWKQLGLAAAAGLICGVVFLIFHLVGGMGAGDVKLITAVGCIAGLSQAGYLLLLTSLAGGVLAIILALYRRRLKETLTNLGALILHFRLEGYQPHPELNVSNSQTLRLPYAVAIAAGTALTMFLQASQR